MNESSPLKHYQQRLEVFFKNYFDRLAQPPQPLNDAIRYMLLNGGKRFRACLVYGAAEIFHPHLAIADPMAAALECIHTYSLVHDDLPAMDNSNLRRGKASCHVAFDEATAILVGDSLQSMAFSLLSTPNTLLSADQQLKMIHLLANACGAEGMAGGQTLDLAFTGNATATLQDIEHIHSLKTTALIHAAVQLGALTASTITDAALETLTRYSHAVGLGFQIRDDILDCCTASEIMGKPQGLDQQQGKSTYVTLLGLETAQKHCDELLATALACLQDLPGDTKTLAYLARLAVDRAC
jgi:farnesyl diphosphate synthase